MITARKLEIFDKYAGEIDAWARTGSTEECAAMSEAEWLEIAALVQDLAAVRSGRVSPEFVARVERRLGALGADAALAEGLRRLA